MKYDNSNGGKPSCQVQHNATSKSGQKHTMPAPGSPPSPAPMTGHMNHAIDPKSSMGHSSFEK